MEPRITTSVARVVNQALAHEPPRRGWPPPDRLRRAATVLRLTAPDQVVARACGVSGLRGRPGPPLGRAIADLAARCGYSLTRLADETGISRITLSRIANGHSWPNASTLERVAAALEYEDAAAMVRDAFAGRNA